MRKKSLIIGFISCFFDQLIKYVINKSFYYGQIKTIIPNLFYVTKVYNDGAAWSSLRGSRYLLIATAIVSLIILLVYQKKFLPNNKNRLAFGLVYGGLLGNLIDRVFLGHVVDFFKVNLGTYEFPIFNIADVLILMGFALIIYGIFRKEDTYGHNSR